MLAANYLHPLRVPGLFFSLFLIDTPRDRRTEVPVAPPAAAAPWIIIVHGPLLANRVVMADWADNQRLLLASTLRVTVADSLLARRPSLQLALFWGPGWRAAYESAEVRSRLRPEQATQRGRYLPRFRGDAALLILEGVPGEGRSVRKINADGVALLGKYGVPARVE
jgi:hypothetical protein